jgi:hypothetical protein
MAPRAKHEVAVLANEPQIDAPREARVEQERRFERCEAGAEHEDTLRGAQPARCQATHHEAPFASTPSA